MKISVIIPVKNEKIFYLKRVLRNISKIFKDCKLEIIISKTVEDTINLDEAKNLIIINSSAGRGKQLNKGAEIATGEILVFLHCDTLLPDNCYELIKNIKENEIFSFKFGTYSRNSNKIFFKILEFFTNLRAAVTKTPYGDQCYILKKDTFTKIGNFLEEPLEDIKFIDNAKKKGVKVKILNAKIKTSPRKYYREGFLFTIIKNRVSVILYLYNRVFNKLYKNNLECLNRKL